MTTNVKALQALYVQLGGSLTDTYADIADGIPVGEMSLIPDMIEAVAKKATGGGGEGGDGNPVLPLLMLKSFEPQSFEDNGTTYYCLGIRTDEQLVKGGMDDLTIEEFGSLMGYWRGSNATCNYLAKVFDSREQQWYEHVWHNTDTLLAICAIETTDPYDLWKQVADAMYAAEPDESGWDIRIQSADQTLSEYLKTSDLAIAITPFIPSVPQSVVLAGNIPSGGTGIADITTITSVDSSVTAEHIYDSLTGRGCFGYVIFRAEDGLTEIGRQNVWLFETEDRTDPDNPVYTIGFHFFDGTNMRLASFTGTGSDTVEFTVAAAI